jgi:phage repressor protein C with HTH and peptisase S24 domain
LGWSLTRYQHYEDRYKRRFLPFELARALEDIFVPNGVDAGAVLQLAGIEPGQPVANKRETGQQRPLSLNAASGQRDLPVIGAVKGGSDGFYFNEGEPKEFVERPANLKGVFNAFALYVDGESMEPRYFAGELLYVNPNRPITKSCFVAVELEDGQGLIKQFLRRSDDEVVLYQFNPPQEIHLRSAQVKRIYRITGSGEAP